jgi:hypothetical protein
MAFDKEKVRREIEIIAEKISAEADPRVLNEYRALFKKGFSFFRRSWAAAYLLMLYDQGQGLGPGRDRGAARSRSRGPSWEGREKNPNRAEASGRRGEGESGGRPADSAPRPFLAEEESRRLFISVGRNRHVFPREILGLIITRAQVAREDIGMIRILDSYSFVQVRDTVADRVIEALDGTMFRGRPMTANYARLKREEGAAEGGLADTEGGPVDAEDTAMETAAPFPYAAGASGPEGCLEGYAEAPDSGEDYPERRDLNEDYSGRPEPGGDDPGDSEQGDDQDDEEGV